MKKNPLRTAPLSATASRRELLVSCLGASLTVAFAPAALAAASARRGRAGDPGGNLVVLQLSGGNDGLSTLVPFGDDAYHRLRPSLRLDPAAVLRLDDYRGFHPALKGLHARYDAGTVAVVQGAGYARPIRSHFKSMDVWHAGDRSGRNVGEGWIGRLAPHLTPEPDPLQVVHIGQRTPFSLHSNVRPPIAFTVPEAYRWVEHGEALADLGNRKGGGDPSSAHAQALAHLRSAAAAAGKSSERVRRAVARHRPAQEYPAGELPAALRIAAALLAEDGGTRVVSLELGGFDHHNDLRNRHDRLMTTLDAALAPFLADLEASEAGRRTAVLCFSEFGRRVAENGSRGADHGKASTVLVLGHGVHGGLHGEHPSLTELDDGDLAYTTDFRGVYAGLIRDQFGIDPALVLGSDVTPLTLASV